MKKIFFSLSLIVMLCCSFCANAAVKATTSDLNVESLSSASSDVIIVVIETPDETIIIIIH